MIYHADISWSRVGRGWVGWGRGSRVGRGVGRGVVGGSDASRLNNDNNNDNNDNNNYWSQASPLPPRAGIQ